MAESDMSPDSIPNDWLHVPETHGFNCVIQPVSSLTVNKRGNKRWGWLIWYLRGQVFEYGRYLLILTRNGMEKRIYWITVKNSRSRNECWIIAKMGAVIEVNSYVEDSRWEVKGYGVKWRSEFCINEKNLASKVIE